MVLFLIVIIQQIRHQTHVVFFYIFLFGSIEVLISKRVDDFLLIRVVGIIVLNMVLFDGRHDLSVLEQHVG